MSPDTAQKLQTALEQLHSKQQLRALPHSQKHGVHIVTNGKTLLNVSSNDYLGLATDDNLQAEFLDQINQRPNHALMGAASSRLLTGNDEQIDQLESELEAWYRSAAGAASNSPNNHINNDVNNNANNYVNNSRNHKAALIFNSGYHANMGLLPALTALPIKTLILADKLIHASMIDGIRLSISKHCSYRRYRHNDYEHLQALIDNMADDIARIIIVTESVFSMDGDRADLSVLAELKAKDPRIELYVDEAHAIGVLGKSGLGLAEVTQTLGQIDYIIGTFGKAFASVGAYVLCDAPIKQWLINQMRPLIFSTALPPINHVWTRFILTKMPALTHQREHVAQLSDQLRLAIASTTAPIAQSAATHHNHSNPSPIVPYILGNNERAVAKARALQEAGFYALPIRPPTVPAGTARIRLVMNAAMSHDDVTRLIAHL